MPLNGFRKDNDKNPVLLVGKHTQKPKCYNCIYGLWKQLFGQLLNEYKNNY